MKDIIFSTFYIHLTREEIAGVVKEKAASLKYKWETLPPLFDQSSDYISILFKSAKLFHKDCTNVLVTDFATQIELPEDVKILRYDVDRTRLIYMKWVYQIQFLKERYWDNHVIFLDNDIIVNGSLEDLFDRDFDVALATQNVPGGALCELPINNGVIMVHGKNKEKGIQFLEDTLALYKEKYSRPNLLMWRGGEHALRDMIGYETVLNRKSDLLEIKGYKVLILDADTYNYTSDNLILMDAPYKDKKILHFKHLRKAEMVNYWKVHLSP